MANSPILHASPDVLPRSSRIDARQERAGRSADSALVAGLLITVAQQDREIAELRRRAAPPLLTADGVGEMLGVSAHSVRQWSDRGQLAYILLPGGARRFTAECVAALLASCERVSAT